MFMIAFVQNILRGRDVMDNNLKLIQIAMIFAIAGTLLVMSILKKSGRLNSKMTINLVIIMGCVMRIGYAIYTPCTVRAHDLGYLVSEDFGKAAYVLRIMETGRLPDSFDQQLYQQPLYYVLAALCAGIVRIFAQNVDAATLLDAGKVISCAASCLMLPVVKKIFDELGISSGNAVFGMIMIAFSPVFYLTGGRLGEDALCAMFMSLALWGTLVWKRNPSWKVTILLALIYGFGMLTKISIMVPAVYTAFVFIRALKKDFKGCFKKLAAFALISIPLGLSFSIRNMVLFGQRIGYVFSQSPEGPLYTGSAPALKRILIPDIANFLKTPFVNSCTDINIFAYMIKTELFGEFIYSITIAIPYILLFFNVLLTTICLISFTCMIIMSIHDKKSSPVIWWMILYILFAAGSYLKYPFGCTMDYRYYAMFTAFKGIIIASLLDRINGGKAACKVISIMCKTGCILFGVFSCIMYCFIGN